MNWQIESTADGLSSAFVDITRATDEDPETQPDSALLSYAKTAAGNLADKLGGNVSVSILGHETTTGDGFRPAHVSITTSRLSPDAGQ
jgi:hypothetical protein